MRSLESELNQTLYQLLRRFDHDADFWGDPAVFVDMTDMPFITDRSGIRLVQLTWPRYEYDQSASQRLATVPTRPQASALTQRYGSMDLATSLQPFVYLDCYRTGIDGKANIGEHPYVDFGLNKLHLNRIISVASLLGNDTGQ